MASQLTFQMETIQNGAVSLVPEIDGTRLTELVADFEAGFSDSPTGGYGGIVPQHFKFGDLSKYYLGLDDHQWPAPGEVWLLGCECGEVGCWPLSAHVAVTEEMVVWSGFKQPYRTKRDYSRLGPFEFTRSQYDAAVQAAIAEMPDDQTTFDSHRSELRDSDGNLLTEEQARERYDRPFSDRQPDDQ
ncbi:hypothetical protein SAMN06295879_2056 [Agreia bicolorata]|uniref:Uncharacterized protein n=1 Tax=Agreia bicolorata TaxID=110935 RepID=A0A1T4Y207_9MICO|nr:hypothetical protein [Agreia bicolorata]SKA95663.1 hypothetical protein SAMN06295879_2056 [Agreia bicolorata]